MLTMITPGTGVAGRKDKEDIKCKTNMYVSVPWNFRDDAKSKQDTDVNGNSAVNLNEEEKEYILQSQWSGDNA